MEIAKNLISKIKEFGLNTYEAKMWTALLSRGVSTAGELSDIANIPRSRSYDVLESLEKKGFITQKIGKPIKYIALSPNEALERVKKKIKKNLEEEEKKLEELKNSELLTELVLLHNQGIETKDPTEITGSLKGINNIYAHMEYMLKNAKEEVFFVTTEQGIIKKTKEFEKHIKNAKDKGIKIFFAAPLTDKTETVQEKLNNYIIFTNINEPTSRYMIVDKKNVAIILTNEKEVHPDYELAIWIQSENLAKTLLSSLKIE